MNPNLTLPRIRSLIRFALGAVLLVAALAKLTHLGEFVRAFSVLPYVTWAGWRPLAMLLPAAELVIGIRLILNGADDEEAASSALAMYTIFFLYQLAVLRHTGLTGRPASSCPCFVFGSTETSPQYVMVLRNTGLLVLAVAGCFPFRRGSPPSVPAGP